MRFESFSSAEKWKIVYTFNLINNELSLNEFKLKNKLIVVFLNNVDLKVDKQDFRTLNELDFRDFIA